MKSVVDTTSFYNANCSRWTKFKEKMQSQSQSAKSANVPNWAAHEIWHGNLTYDAT